MNTDNGCPCCYTDPCRPGCACVDSTSPHGCLRCCRYGSLEDRKRRAKALAFLLTCGQNFAQGMADEAKMLGA